MLNNLVNILSKEKHLVDAFEILISLLENNAVGISSLEDDLLPIRESFLILLVSGIQGLLSLGQLLYTQYVPYLRNTSSIKTYVDGEELHKSINYDFNILDV